MKNLVMSRPCVKFMFLILILLSNMVLFLPPSFAAGYPAKPITMIVAYSAGGGSDLAARTVAQYMEKYLGQAVIVENRSGAGGQIGFTTLAKAKADGYTIGMLNVPAMNMLASLRPNATYKSSQLVPIGNVILDPVVLAVGANSTFDGMSDFVEFAKDNPGKIILGVDGPQTNAQLQPLIMQSALDIKINYVFYNGAAPALTAAIGGHTFGTTPGASEAQPYVDNGQIKVLAVFSEERFPGLPDVPTFKEATGLDISYVPSNRGFGIPLGVPDDIKKKLEKTLEQVVNDPDFQARAEEIGLPLYFEKADVFAEKMRVLEKEIKQYKDILTPDE